MAGDYPGCGAELRSGGERRACQCVISRAGLGGKWHCDGRHRPGWGDLCVSVSSSQRRSSAHILIGVLLQAPSHCLVTTPQMGTLPHVITITSSYSSIIPVAIAQQYSQSLPCCSAWIYSIAILCNHLFVWHQPRYARMQHVLMLMSRRLKALSAKRIFTIRW